MSTAEALIPQDSQRSFFICAVVSIVIHTGLVAGLSLLPHVERQEEHIPVVKVTLQAVTQQDQTNSSHQPPPSMRSTTRPSHSTPFASSTPTPVQRFNPISMTASIKPLTTQIEEEQPPIPLKNRVLRDQQAANALLGKSLVKMAKQPLNTVPPNQVSQASSSPLQHVQNRTAKVSPLAQRRASSTESTILARIPNRKALLTPPPGGQGISGSKVGLVNSIPPMYPRVAREAGWEGTVIVRVLVGTNGIPIETHVQKSSGHPVLDEAAIEAVRAWRFNAAKDGNIPIKSFVDIPVNFDLHNR